MDSSIRHRRAERALYLGRGQPEPVLDDLPGVLPTFLNALLTTPCNRDSKAPCQDNKKPRSDAGAFSFLTPGGDQYLPTTGPPQPQLKR
jgi:hypothetical protein